MGPDGEGKYSSLCPGLFLLLVGRGDRTGGLELSGKGAEQGGAGLQTEQQCLSLQSHGVRDRPPWVFLKRCQLHPPEMGLCRGASDSSKATTWLSG